MAIDWTDGRQRHVSSRPPRRSADVAMSLVDDCAVLGLERTGALVRLDPVSTALWTLFDGQTSVADLSADLETIGVTPLKEARESVESLVTQLAASGMLDGRSLEDLPDRRSQKPRWDSCSGRRMGLDRAAWVRVPGDEFILGCTDPEVLASVAGDEHQPGVDAPAEVIHLQIAGRPGRTRRLQRIWGANGRLLHWSHGHAEAIAAFKRTIAARRLVPSGAWVERVGLHRDGRIVILAPEFHSGVGVELRRELALRDIGCPPAGLLRIDGGGDRLTIVGEEAAGEPRISCEPVGVVTGIGYDRVERHRSTLGLAHRLDQQHFDALGALVEGLPQTAADPNGDPRATVAVIEGLLAT